MDTVDIKTKEDMIFHIDSIINNINAVLTKIYSHNNIAYDSIIELLQSLSSIIKIYKEINPIYKFDIIGIGVKNLKSFLNEPNYVLLIDTLEFEIKSSLIEMKYSI